MNKLTDLIKRDLQSMLDYGILNGESEDKLLVLSEVIEHINFLEQKYINDYLNELYRAKDDK